MNSELREKNIDFLKRRLELYCESRNLTREDYERNKEMGYEKYKQNVIKMDSYYTKEEFNNMLLDICSSILDLDRLINQVRFELLNLGEIIF